MTISVFTASHNPRWLGDAYDSLAAQTTHDWEWVVALNGDAAWSPPDDERVHAATVDTPAGNVGAAKHAAVERCTGSILVELDHDDLLTPTCLEQVAATFDDHPDAALVYSDFAQINADATPNFDQFNAACGWQYTLDGGYLRCHALEPSPHNVAYIWYAPNHVRAFRRSVFDQAGGYNPDMRVLDDHDLMIRLYQAGEFVHIPECLYLQRVHDGNTQRDAGTNAHIQAQTVANYHNHVVALAAAWARRNGLAIVTLTTATSPPSADPDRGEIVVVDPDKPVLPFHDNTVGVIKASELLQRVANPAGLFNECHRAFAHGGILFTLTPSTDGRGAFQDPSHLTFWNENSFWYWTDPARRTSTPELVSRWQVSNLRTWFPTAWDEEHHIPYVQANLLAVKDGPRQGGPLL